MHCIVHPPQLWEGGYPTFVCAELQLFVFLHILKCYMRSNLFTHVTQGQVTVKGKEGERETKGGANVNDKGAEGP